MPLLPKERDTLLGWGKDVRARNLKRLDKRQINGMCRMVARMIKHWALTKDACLAVAQAKDLSRPFAWGAEGVRDLTDAIEFSQVIEAALLNDETPPCEPFPGHRTYLCLGQIVRVHRDDFGVDFYSDDGAQFFRAIYHLLLVMLQPGVPLADVYEIDVDGLVTFLEMKNRAALFNLAEEEALRPGCQFGVLAWEEREQAREAMMGMSM